MTTSSKKYKFVLLIVPMAIEITCTTLYFNAIYAASVFDHTVINDDSDEVQTSLVKTKDTLKKTLRYCSRSAMTIAPPPYTKKAFHFCKCFYLCIYIQHRSQLHAPRWWFYYLSGTGGFLLKDER